MSLFISFEGGEGAGKTTQAAALADRLRQTGIEVITVREPGGTAVGESIRRLVKGVGLAPEAELLLFAAARAQLVATVIRPSLDAGKVVIADRYADSTMAYQSYGLGVGREAVEALYRIVVGTFAPNLTIILDLAPELGLERSRGCETGEDRYERMDQAFHRRLREGYLDIARREPERCAVIAADGAMEEVEAEILATVGERLGVEF